MQYCPRSSPICESHSGKKTDKRDAKWIANIFKHDLVAGSFIPLPDICQLKSDKVVAIKSPTHAFDCWLCLPPYTSQEKACFAQNLQQLIQLVHETESYPKAD